MKLSLLGASLALVAGQQLPIATAGIYGAPRVTPYGYGGVYGAPLVSPYAGAYGRPYVAPAPVIVVPEPEPTPAPEPAMSSPQKTLEYMDMYLSTWLLNNGHFSAPEYYYSDGAMKKATANNNMLNMMMMSQGIGGTGANNMLFYNLLQRQSNPTRYYKDASGVVFPEGADGPMVNGYGQVGSSSVMESVMLSNAMGWGNPIEESMPVYMAMVPGPTFDSSLGAQSFAMMEANIMASGGW